MSHRHLNRWVSHVNISQQHIIFYAPALHRKHFRYTVTFLKHKSSNMKVNMATFKHVREYKDLYNTEYICTFCISSKHTQAHTHCQNCWQTKPDKQLLSQHTHSIIPWVHCASVMTFPAACGVKFITPPPGSSVVFPKCSTMPAVDLHSAQSLVNRKNKRF